MGACGERAERRPHVAGTMGRDSGRAAPTGPASSAYAECPTFQLTDEDIAGGFEAYIERIEDVLAKWGVAKLVPPASWQPRKAGYGNLRLRVEKPIRQNASGGRGLWRHYSTTQKDMSLDEFREHIESAGAARPPEAIAGDIDALERHFWRNLTFSPPLYGADIKGSATDSSCKEFSCRRLNDFLRRALKGAGVHIPGVNEPYLYVGSWRADFAMHTEDLDLYSINYLHFGEPKSWYVVPPPDKKKFEALARELAPELFDKERGCTEFLRHKELMISPSLCAKRGIKLVRLTQSERDFVINFPGAYHCGFNHGFNLAESTNFATRRWVPYGCAARTCDCSADAVRFDMKLFGVHDVKECAKAVQGDSSDDEDFMRIARARRARAGAEKNRRAAVCVLCNKRRLVSATRMPNWPGTKFICALLPDMHCRIAEEQAARDAADLVPLASSKDVKPGLVTNLAAKKCSVSDPSAERERPSRPAARRRKPGIATFKRGSKRVRV